MSLGTQLRHIRQIRKQTLAEVGGSTDLSISYISKIERDLAEPTIDILKKLANHYGVSAASLLSENEPVVDLTQSVHRASFRHFVEKMNGKVDSAMQDLLLRVDAQSYKPAQTIDEWLRYYYVISSVTEER